MNTELNALPPELLDDADHGGEQHQGPTESEVRAMRSGWQPKEKFKGNPEKWRPADQWNDRADEYIPIARAENRNLHDKVTKLEQELAESREVITASKQFMTGIEERARQHAIETLKGQRREALTNQDGAAFEEADEQIRKLETPKVEDKPAPKQLPPEIASVVKRHSDEATWYNEDAELKSFADTVAETLRKQGFNPLASPEAADDFLTKIKDRTMRAYPEKFGRRPAGNGKAPMFEPGGGQRQQAGAKSFERMRPEFQQACDKMMGKGMFKTREAYVKLAPPEAFY